MQYVARRNKGKAAGLALDAEALARYDDIIDLSIGDTDFITDRRIIDAAYRDACAGATRYGYPQGDPELIDAIRKAWREDFGQEVGREELVVTASSCLGMALALLAILDPGDEVIVFGPYFPVYKQQIELAGGVCVEVCTDERDGYAIDEALLRAAITDRTRAMIFNNPCNPTGAAYSEADMAMLARVACERDLLILADEIYTRYLFDGAFTPMRTLPGMAQRTVTLNSFSKNFMMTGWRVGFIIAPPELIAAILYINGGMIYTAPSVSQRAALHALALRDDIQRVYISQYKERVYYTSERIESIPHMTLVRPRGTFYLFPGIARTGLSAPAYCDFALREAHVLLSPGDAFGVSGKGHVRIACTAGLPALREAMDRLAKLPV